MNKFLSTLSFFGIVLVAGCSAPQPQHHMKLGSSAQALVDEQTYNPQAAEENGTALHSTLDGATGVNILSTYRRDISKPKEVKNTIHVNVGN
jgi:hypothetical protein